LIVNLWLLAWFFFANSGSRDDISPIARRHTGPTAQPLLLRDNEVIQWGPRSFGS